MYDIDIREQDVTALDTDTPLVDVGADAPGAFVVPSHASRITEILIGAIPDYTADTLEGYTSAVKLSGPGLKAPESWIPGPSGIVGGVATTSAGLGIIKPMHYYCNIPVNPGQLISASGFMHGSADMGSLRVTCTLVYDGPIIGRWSYMDYREGDTAAANTGVALANRGGIAAGDFRPSGKIVEIVVGVGGVPVAGPLAAPTIVVLSGNGLSVAGNYIFQGPGIYTQDDITASGDAKVCDLVKYECDINVKTNGFIRATAQEINDDVGTPSHIIGLGYL